MNVVIVSFWRNDAHRKLGERAEHLLSKRSVTHNVRWFWVVGDSDDSTEAELREIAERASTPGRMKWVTVERHDSGVPVGAGVEFKRHRISQTYQKAFANLSAWDDLVLLYESDLQTAPEIVDQLYEAGPLPRAGWPTIHLGKEPQFYDTWAYRGLDGAPFAQWTKLEGPVRVSGFGSLWLAPASLVRGRVLGKLAVGDLCQQWHAEGVEMWADPRIPVVQPVDLWIDDDDS